jgi:hypothetical protein
LNFLNEYGYKCYRFVKGGLEGPITEVHPQSENYCFLTSEHLKMEKVNRVLI